MNKETDQELSHIRHSLAHLLAAAVLELYPDAKRAIGPAIDNGFYYDFEFSTPISDNDLKEIEKKMKKLYNSWGPFERFEVSKEEALEEFKDNPYKTELIEEFAEEGKTLTIYQSGNFRDLCGGGHVEDMKSIDMKAFKIEKLAGAYWRGDEKNKMLTRIYGLAFNSKEELDAYIKQQEEARERDHRKVGKELDLFHFSEVVGLGLPLYTPKGSIIRRELERFIVDEEVKRGYVHVYTPDVAKLDLYRKSGHYPHYKDSMYAPIDIDGDEFMLRPMTCPHHFELYDRKPHSYKELPVRIAELAQLYRYEQSGEMNGLIRVRSFCLADAHIICKDEEQAAEEVSGALDLIDFVAGVFGLKMGEDYWYTLSLGDRGNTEKYADNPAAWDKAESLLREVLQNRDCTFTEEEDEAAFYGPKIDIQMKNVNGKEDTAFTVQYDFVMPERFNLQYIAQDGTKKQAFVVHRSSIGAIERIMAFLIEKYGGAFPLWLAPVQVKVLPIAETHHEHAASVAKQLESANIRVELDDTNESFGKKVRKAKVEKIPYFIVIGDEEVKNNTVTLESRDSEDKESLSPDDLESKLITQIKNRT